MSYYTVPIGSDDSELAPLWLQFDKKLKLKSLDEIASDEEIDEPLFAAIRKRQFDREAPLLVITIRRLLDRTLRIVDGGVILEGVFSPDAVCFNSEVEDLLSR